MVINVSSSLLYGYCASGLVRVSTKGVGDSSVALINNFVEQLEVVFDDYLP